MNNYRKAKLFQSVQDYPNIVLDYLHYGGSVNIICNNKSLLDEAVKHKNRTIVKELLRRGAFPQ